MNSDGTVHAGDTVQSGDGEHPDEDHGSLADQAAAWVPPWLRATIPDEDVEPEFVAVDRSDQTEPDQTAPDQTEPDQVAPEQVEQVAPEQVAPEQTAAEQIAGERNAPEQTEPAATGPGIVEPPTTVAADARTGDEIFDDTAAEPSADLKAALEAILLVVDEPVAEQLLAEVLDVPIAAVAAQLIEVAAEYTAQGRGFDLRRAAGGWRLYTRAEYAGYVERFVLDGQSVRLTQAALETLAVIAYQQPVTRSRISAIRGVNCDGVIRTLVTRGLIEECGTQPESGAFLYRTTSVFLEKLGLDSVDELPPLAPFLPDDVNGFADAGR